ncbi:MAG: hypothetical protein NXH75_12560, partial [Halobacteriovoraceae bacterium]|nr:hypothetical protein [Halobacteriovoraceae bacterium]
GFYHMKCPPGTDYAGQFACDRASNGAYTIGSIFIKKSLEVCRDCTEEEKDSLRIHYFDSQSRVMNKKILTPEDVEKINQLENQLDHTAHQLFQVSGENQSVRTRILEEEIQNILSEIKEIKAFDEKSQAKHWDATPEVIGIYHE